MPVPVPEGRYAWIYLLAVFCGLVVIFIEGRRKQWPAVTLAVLMHALVLSGILGSKVMALLIQGRLGGASFLGLLLGGLAVVPWAGRWLGFRRSVGDIFALSLPVTLFIIRIGCLLAGCCSGAGTFLPLPLYEMLFCLLILGFIPFARKRLKAPGSLLYAVSFSYLVFRFFEEFVRFGGAGHFGLKDAQWACLLAAAASLVCLIRNERKGPLSEPESPAADNFSGVLLLLAGSAFFVFVLRAYLTNFEKGVISVSCIFLLINLAATFLRLPRHKKRDVLAYGMMSLSLLAVIGAYGRGSDSTVTNPAESGPKSHYTLSLGGMAGSYTTICGGAHPYSGGGVGIAEHYEFGNGNRTSWGVRGYAARVDQGDRTVAGVNPYFSADNEYLGVSLGIHYGHYEARGLFFDEDFFAPNLFPHLRLKVGYKDKILVEGSYGDHFPSSAPAGVFKVGIGTAPPKYGKFLFGFSDAGFFGDLNFRLKDNFHFNPFIALGGTNDFQFALSVHYDFDFQNK